jgi:hypothetical protein
MTTKPLRTAAGRLQLLLIAAVFAVPLAMAAWMYYFDNSLVPESGSNKGALLLPIVSLGDQLPQSQLHSIAPQQWLLLYANDHACGGDCEQALVRLRQSRLMLGKDMQRVARVFLHGDSVPDTVLLNEQHTGLITMTDKDLAVLLEEKRPTGLPAGGCYLIDPLGNLVMYFPPNLDPKEMVGDIKHLLKLSHIG